MTYPRDTQTMATRTLARQTPQSGRARQALQAPAGRPVSHGALPPVPAEVRVFPPARTSASTTSAPAPVLIVTATPGQAAQLRAVLLAGGLSNPVTAVHSTDEAGEYLLGQGAWGDRRRHPLPAVVVTGLHLHAPQRAAQDRLLGQVPTETASAPGIDLLRLKKTHGGLFDVPVIVVGSHASDAEIELVHELGGAAYLAESMIESILVDVIRGLGLSWTLTPAAGASCA